MGEGCSSPGAKLPYETCETEVSQGKGRLGETIFIAHSLLEFSR